MTFSIDSQSGPHPILRIEGQLNALSVPEIRPALDSLLAGSPRRIEVDLSALALIDSSGVGALVSLFRRCRAQGGELLVSGCSGQPLAILKLLRLDSVFTIT